MPIINLKQPLLITTILSLLSGCATQSATPQPQPAVPTLENPAYILQHSYLHQPRNQAAQPEPQPVGQATSEQSAPDSAVQQPATAIQPLSPLSRRPFAASANKGIGLNLSTQPNLTIAAEAMPLNHFIHYALGEQLGLNYVLGPDVETINAPVTLNLQQPISKQRLFELLQKLLYERQVGMKLDGELLLVHKLSADSSGTTRISIGADPASVPNISGKVMQAVPLKYGIKFSIRTTLNALTKARITVDSAQNVIFIDGQREEVVQAMELIALMDRPSNRGKHIGLIELTFAEPNQYIGDMIKLLENDGINSAKDSPSNNSVVFVPLASVNSVIAFAADESLLQRVDFWTRMLDKPKQGEGKSYYTYQPRYARAADIGESLQPLIDDSGTSFSSGSTTASNPSDTGNAPSTRRRAASGSNDKLTFVVDERSNSLIFHASGADYQTLLPLIESLDLLPKQVMLDITIVEVRLTDEFSLGVEWALKNDEDWKLQTAFGVGQGSGFNLNLTGHDGSALAKAFQSNRLANLLSNPTLLVRDGVSASISVGSQISITTGTSQSSDNSDAPITTNSEYVSTGVEVTVTPTINAQGVVIMNINQSISNEVADSSGAGGNPDIFERKLSTEVVAESGQTIILAGLVSGDSSDNDSAVPGVARIPLLGKLFNSEGQSSTKTELVMLVTPRVINSSEQWDDVKAEFQRGLSQITLPGQQ